MRDIVMAWEGDTVLVAGSSWPAVVSVRIDGEPYPTARVRLSSSNQDVLSVDPDGATLHARRLGSVVLTAELQDATLPRHGPRLQTNLVVSPGAISVSLPPDTLRSLGDTVRLTAAVLDAAGQAIGVAPVQWSSTDTSVARVDASGLVTALGNGTAAIEARVSATSATSTIVVRQRLAAFEFSPPSVTFDALGADTLVTIRALDARGVPLHPPTPSVTWSTADPAIATVSNGRVTAAAPGMTWLRAVAGSHRDSIPTAVQQLAARVVVETPAPVALQSIGESVTLTARAYDRRANEIQTGVPSWRSLNPRTVYVEAQTGIATGLTVGSAGVVATLDGVSDTIVVDVANVVARVIVEPDVATLTSIGDVLRPTVTTRNALGNAVPAPSLTWNVSDTTVARLQPDGSVVAAAAGTARIVVSAGMAADTLVLTVRNDAVHLDILRATATIPAIGDSIVLAAVALNGRGDTLSVAGVAWSVDDPVVARVSATGTVTARAVGTTWVRATSGGASDSASIVVTNAPASIAVLLAATGQEAVLDTMTAAGQALDYDVTVTNLARLPITDATVTWRSSDAAVATVTPAGIATALGFGSAWIIAEAGQVADSVRLVVTDPRRLYVDNAVVTPVRFGTIARPYATIQDAVDAAGVDDTVIVQRGNSYSEAVTLGRRVTLLGDSTAFVAGGRNPLLLPLLRHDLGPAGITTATPGASYTIRFLGIQHSVDGEAIAARDVDNLVLSDIFVNPVPGFRTGRGILVDRPAGTLHVARTQVDSVYAFGIRIRDAAAARLENVTVRAVAARNADAGAGIEVLGGSGIVQGATVLRTAGPQVVFSRTWGASLLASALAGEQQLVRLDSVRGATTIAGNTFDLRRQPGEAAPVRGGAMPDPSALEILGSPGTLVEGNVFIDIDGQASLMDGIRLADVRVGTSGAPYGALLSRNQFRGGRAAVRSARSTWSMTASRVDSAAYGALLTDADTVTLARDTIASARIAAVLSSGIAASVEVTESRMIGAQRAVHVTNAARVTIRHGAIAGTTFTGIAQPMAGAVDLSATAVEVAHTTIAGMRGWAGLVLRSGNARADSNVITRNLVGVRLGAASLPSLTANAVFDNDTLPAASARAARGVVNDGAPVAIGANWWGAPEGPASDAPLAPPARGDSITGGITAGVLAAPIAAHQSSAVYAGFRRIAGDGQTGTVGVELPNPLAVRAVDDTGRPLAGFTATFRVSRTRGDFVGSVRNGNENIVTVLTDANGLAEARYVPAIAGPTTITSTVDRTSIPFTVTVP